MIKFFKKLFWKKKKNEIIKKILPANYKKMPKWKLALYICFYVFVVFVFVIAIAFAWFAKDLPTPAKIASRKAVESTKLYDRTGTVLLYETGDQKRTVVTGDQISQYLKDSTVATEDANFYKHHGFDTKAIFRAVYDKLTGKTSRVSGTSTITQQYVKNALLTSDRSITRKFKELILAVELEFMFNKDQILTMYLNEIPYGNSNAGAESASKMYFGKPAKDLTLAEAATLTAIPQAPTYYSPYGTHTKELVNRKNYVLDRMVETGKISKEDADKAKAEDTLALGTTLKPRHDSMLAPHFAMYTLQQIADKYGEEKIQKEGLKVITTLDYDKQKLAQQAITDNRKNLNKNNGENAALVSIDPKTGQILDMVGSVDYFDTKIDGNVNVTDSLRQPGSSFKIFDYSTVLKKKEYSPSKIFYDLQTDFGNGYIPKNYSGRFVGPVTMRAALQNSFNIPAIKAASVSGLDNVIQTAHDLGITSLNDRSRYGASLGIGVAEVKPVDMANAYGTLANNGNRQDLTPILKVTDSNGKILYDFDKDHQSKDVIDPQITYEMSSMLSDNNSRAQTFGSHSALYFADRPVAAKTGTTQENRDGWTCGYTPSLVTVVWAGNNMPSPMKRDAVELAGPIFHQFMTNALAGTPAEQFVVPAGIQTVTVERYSNKLPNDLSTDKTTDIFASWQIPTEQDDVHVKVKVCKVNGQLAPKDLPDSLSEDRIFTSIHSEKPDNSNWENPVIAWAQANGMYSAVPTEYCSAKDTTPTLSFSSPANEASISGIATISVATSATPKITSVEYFIDNISIGTGDVASSSFSKSYDFSTLAGGSHQLSAIGTDENSTTVKSTISINVPMSSISASASKNSATITWTTDLPSTSLVSYRISASDSYTDSDFSSSLSTSHSVTLSGLIANTTYYYKVTSVDGANNSKTSEVKSFTTLP